MVQQPKHPVLVVDEHLVWRRGIVAVLQDQPDLGVCGESGEPQTTPQLVRKLKPRLVVLDLTDGLTEGSSLVKALAAQDPSLAVLIYSLRDERVFAERFIRAGARGYVMKQEPVSVFLAAVREVLAGRVYLSQRMREVILGRALAGVGQRGAPDVSRLSDREMQFLTLMGQGLTTEEIARQMNVRVRTLDAYRAHVKRKLMARNQTELMRLAVLHAERMRLDAQAGLDRPPQPAAT